MKKIVCVIVLFAIHISCSKAQKTSFSEESLNETLQNQEGNTIAFKDILKQHKGKTVVIEFWASWCSDCVKAMPKIKSLQEQNANVDYVFISLDKSFEKFKAGVAKHQLMGTHYWLNDADGMKGKFGKSIDLDWIPRYMIINKEGTIVTYRAIETDYDAINKTLKTLE